MALTVFEQADEGSCLRVVGHAGLALLLRNMEIDPRSEKATGLARDNLSVVYSATAGKTLCQIRMCT